MPLAAQVGISIALLIFALAIMGVSVKSSRKKEPVQHDMGVVTIADMKPSRDAVDVLRGIAGDVKRIADSLEERERSDSMSREVERQINRGRDDPRRR